MAARMLRNLRMIYEKGEDPARLLGWLNARCFVAEQDVEMKAVPDANARTAARRWAFVCWPCATKTGGTDGRRSA